MEIPQSKWQRSVAGGKTAARIGGKIAGYLARKPFLSGDGQRKAKENLNRASADILFQGLALLKGTALKIAQQLSLEFDLIPEALQKELEKSYHQAPPLNRALVRKMLTNAFGRPPEAMFAQFENTAFAAASLGQVHRAFTETGRPLAVKIQYPGIDRTIESDMQLVKNLLRPLPDYQLWLPTLDEIEARLMEEVDYGKEADHLRFFRQHLCVSGVRMPDIHAETSCNTVLSLTYLEGLPLDRWIETHPPAGARDRVARILHTIFMKGLYEHACIHADPNPGNFIVHPDGSVGLVDFGCIKRFSPDFVDLYRQLPKVLVDGDRERHFKLMVDLKVVDGDMDRQTRDAFFRAMENLAGWFGKLFAENVFDFGANSDFMKEGRKLWEHVYSLRRHLRPNPEFVFLDRTRYGLLRIFEKMGARVCMRTPYEFTDG